MNEFLKSLQAFGMEGMGTEVEIEAYASSECAEELIELDNIDAATVAMESMSDAIMEGGLEMQTLALESAGFTLDTASGFSGELSNEAVTNMIKRGYYEVKIQVKKAVQKIWKLVVSVIDHVLGSDGRLKSYGKLFKKYKERLNKVQPKEGKDGEDKEVTIRQWDKTSTLHVLKAFKIGANTAWMKKVTNGIKVTDPVKAVDAFADAVTEAFKGFEQMIKDIASDEAATKISTAMTKSAPKLTGLILADVEKFEKDFEENMKDNESLIKDGLNDIIKDFKDVDSDDMNIYDAKNMLFTLAGQLEAECKKDVKFKAELIRMKKAWDKYSGEWDMSKAEKATDDEKAIAASVLRVLNKCGKYITGYRLALSKVYSAIVSNMQGVLADMAKVIAKGTNIGA